MNRLQMIVNADEKLAQSTKIYEILGKFRDKIPKDIQKELSNMAEDCNKERLKILKKLEKSLT